MTQHNTALASSNDATPATLALWKSEEAAVRARLSAPGVASPEQIQGLSGMEIFEAIFRGELPFAPIGETAGIWPIQASHGGFIFQGTPSPAFFNPMGTLHGGWIAMILDSAVGCAVQTTLPATAAYTTAELKISYIRALTPKVERVRAIASVLSAGRQLGFAEARLVDADGRLYAHASTTCLVMPRR